MPVLDEPPENEPINIVCTRAADNPRPIEGASFANCTQCKEPIFVSPTSLDIMLNHGAGTRLICIQCVSAEHAASDEEPTFVRPTPEQVAEVRRSIGRD